VRTQGRRPVRGGRRRGREATGERRWGEPPNAAAEPGTAPPSLDAAEGEPPPRAEDPILGTEPGAAREMSVGAGSRRCVGLMDD
jgi:hypothetical protein